MIKTALVVNAFLPYTHIWIYRQIIDSNINTELVLCQKRENEQEFPFENIIQSGSNSFWVRYVKNRLWFLYKNFEPALPRYSYNIFRKALIEQNIQLVHAHFGIAGAQFLPLCEELNIPLLVTFHGFDISSAPQRWPAYRTALKKLFEKCRLLITISNEMADRLEGIGCDRGKIRISYLGVPLENFPFVDRSNRTGPVRFLHAGRLTAKKGVPYLVRAFDRAFPEPEVALLDIVGDGEEKELVEETIKIENPKNPVIMHGRVSAQQLLKLRESADVFVLNCRKDSAGTMEGLPISTLEAAATGLPAISTYHAGIPESIKDGKTGYLVPENDQVAFAEAMRKMLNRERCQKMGKEARVFMEEKFDLVKCNQVLRNIYDEAHHLHRARGN
ncbi:glycosyltransferase [candidate division KSB1 bacterium]|nr:glycosyltransferase [candidate division KSB1 bacterium]